jgi:hypothetical protein
MDGTGKCKLPSTPPCTVVGRILHLNTKMVKVGIKKHPQMCSYGDYQVNKTKARSKLNKQNRMKKKNNHINYGNKSFFYRYIQ